MNADIAMPKLARRGRNEGRKRKGLFRRFRDDESGIATTEFVIWFPMLVMLVGLSVDVSMTFLQMNRGWDIARDVTRRVSVGELNFEQGQAYATAALPGYLNPSVIITSEGERDIRFNLTLTPRIGVAGLLSIFDIGDLSIDYVMRQETNSNTGGA